MKKIIFGLVAGLLLLGITSCSLETPSKITVKTKASYNFSIGDIQMDMDLKEEIANNMGDYTIYDYNPVGAPDSNVQQFLVSLPIKEIPLNITSEFKKLDLNNLISDMSINQKITVPNALSDNQTGNEIDISDLNDKLNAVVQFFGSVTVSGTSVDLTNIEGFAFDSISYNSGNLLITVEGIKNGSKVTVNFNSSSSAEGTFKDNVAKVPLAGKTLYSTGMSLSFTNGFGNLFTAKVEEGSEIKVASNVTLDQSKTESKVDITIDPITIDNSDSSSYEYCKIGKGEFKIDMKVDSSWSNVGLLLKVESSGGLKITDDTYGDAVKNTKVVNLAGKSIVPEDIKVEPKVEIALNNSTINFEKAPTLDVATDISEFASVSAKVSTKENLKVSQDTPLSKDFTDFIKEIDFEECGFSVNFMNTLPVGNDITLSTSCDFFGIAPSTSAVLEAGSIADDPIDITGKKQVRKIGTGDGEYSSINFNAEIKLPGATEESPDLVTLQNVAPGKEYTIKIDISLKLDWNSIKISSERISDQTAIDLDFSSILDILGNSGVANIILASLPMYLYITRPDSFEALKDASFTAKEFAIKYGTKDEATDTVTFDENIASIKLIDSITAETLKFVNEVDLALTGDDEKIKQTTVNLNYTEFSAMADLASVVQIKNSNTATKPYICYDLALADSSGSGYIEIQNPNKGQADAEEKEEYVSIDALIVLPLQLKATDDMKLDIMKLAKIAQEGDVFGRSEPTDPESLENFMAVLESVNLTYEFNTLPLYSTTPLGLEIDFGAGSKTLSFQKGTIGINRDTIKYMLTTTPYNPSVILPIAKNTVFSVPRNFGVDVHLSLAINTNGEITIFDKEGK